MMQASRTRKTIIVPIAAMLLFGIGALLVFSSSKTDTARPLEDMVSIDGKEYTLEIADTDSKRSLGLGERDSLCSSCAMLFVFDRPGEYAFWMKGMRFPIDIIWLSSGEVVHIERNIPADSVALYRPLKPADRVLEVNAGSTVSLSVGDQVTLPR